MNANGKLRREVNAPRSSERVANNTLGGVPGVPGGMRRTSDLPRAVRVVEAKMQDAEPLDFRTHSARSGVGDSGTRATSERY